MALDVKQVVKTAVSYIEELFPANGTTRLEEVDVDPQDGSWEVTLSYVDEEADPVGVRQFSGQPPARLYKIVTLNRAGEVRSVKIRRP